MIGRIQTRGLKLISTRLSNEASSALKENSKRLRKRAKTLKSTSCETITVRRAEERVAKRIAAAGVCSRRQAETYIETGKVSVNGSVVTALATKVGPHDEVKLNGNKLPALDATKLWMAHKLPSELITRTDPRGRATIFDRMATMGLPNHMIPVVS